ncbi:MAG: hypothetical protein HN704_04740 [Bacteroidetes bacterium]|jgi:hypothetical protein|nr:hypothetical protein [Bacteroidota bacterium]MBT6685841.1 hypothetical protein [Bacteroidota bacterium]MBT7144654.1 hypothetical protein [Bacteroidota bacterium]MBT7490898.1 hypothetical protein [Bacteroidota bacterium]
MLTLDKKTEKKLSNYVSVYNGNYDKMINEILSYRAAQLKKAIRNIELDFAYFEQKYTMKTVEFYELFENGKLGDENSDFFQWSGEYETFQDYQKEIKHLL